MLTHLQENEYKLEDATCWIEVGNKVVWLAHHPDCLILEVYENGGESKTPIYEDSFPFEDEPDAHPTTKC